MELSAAKENRILKMSFMAVLYCLCITVVFEFPTVFYYSPFVIFAVWLVYNLAFEKKLNISVSCLLLAVFALVYFYKIKDLNHDRFYPFYLYLYIVLFYFAGTNILPDRTHLKQKERGFTGFYIFVSLLFISYVTITFLIDFADGGISGSLDPMFLWSDELRVSTDYGVMCLPAIICGAYLLFCGNAKTVGAMLLLLVAADNMLTQRRTVFVQIPLIMIVFLLSVFVFRPWKKKTLFAVAAILCVAAAAAGILLYRYSDVINEYLSNGVLGRLSISSLLGLKDNERFISTKNLLENFSFTYNGGGEYAIQFGNPHNLWLNVYDYGGMLPFVIFSMFTVSTLYYLFKLCFLAKEVSRKLKCLLFTAFTGMVIQCCIEPVLISDVTFVMLTFYIFGVIKGFADSADEKYWITKILENKLKKIKKPG